DRYHFFYLDLSFQKYLYEQLGEMVFTEYLCRELMYTYNHTLHGSSLRDMIFFLRLIIV
ncbi:hypothetical protein ACJX0J_036078, partial [Zea mays]